MFMLLTKYLIIVIDFFINSFLIFISTLFALYLIGFILCFTLFSQKGISSNLPISYVLCAGFLSTVVLTAIFCTGFKTVFSLAFFSFILFYILKIKKKKCFKN